MVNKRIESMLDKDFTKLTDKEVVEALDYIYVHTRHSFMKKEEQYFSLMYELQNIMESRGYKVNYEKHRDEDETIYYVECVKEEEIEWY